VFITAEELLEARQPLPWGGHGLNPNMELRYRFSKAAAKTKEPAICAAEFANYPEDSRHECAAWLKQRWNISLRSWNAHDLGPALATLRQQSNARPSLFQSGALQRIVARIQQPSGMVVITGREDFDSTSVRLKAVFGHLYFRRFRKAEQFHPAFFKDLIASTLVVVPEIGFPWSKLIPSDCLHRMAAGEDCRVIAAHLHQRCKQRETR
jgi:hypothetical protein